MFLFILMAVQQQKSAISILKNNSKWYSEMSGNGGMWKEFKKTPALLSQWLMDRDAGPTFSYSSGLLFYFIFQEVLEIQFFI